MSWKYKSYRNTQIQGITSLKCVTGKQKNLLSVPQFLQYQYNLFEIKNISKLKALLIAPFVTGKPNFRIISETAISRCLEHNPSPTLLKTGSSFFFQT